LLSSQKKKTNHNMKHWSFCFVDGRTSKNHTSNLRLLARIWKVP